MNLTGINFICKNDGLNFFIISFPSVVWLQKPCDDKSLISLVTETVDNAFIAMS